MAFRSKVRSLSLQGNRLFSSSTLNLDSKSPLSSKEKSRAALSLLWFEKNPERILDICRAAALTPESHLDRVAYSFSLLSLLNPIVFFFPSDTHAHKPSSSREIRVFANTSTCFCSMNLGETERSGRDGGVARGRGLCGRVPELNPNSIYFTDTRCPPEWIDRDYGGHDVGIFNYENETFSSCYYPCDLKSVKRIIPTPMWFTPTTLL